MTNSRVLNTSTHFPDHEKVDKIVARAEEILGYTFNDKEILIKALTHPSVVEENIVGLSYERLEFVGDSFLGAIVSMEIYKRFPTMDEGAMSRLKSAVVSGRSLSKIAEELGFAEIIIFGASEFGTNGRGLCSALENVFEAVIAALVIDGGFEVAKQWISKTIFSHITEDKALRVANYKSMFQEVLQNVGRSPTYRVIKETGPPHKRIFTVQAMCDDKVLGTGEGHSKKEAEMAAAQQALDSEFICSLKTAKQEGTNK